MSARGCKRQIHGVVGGLELSFFLRNVLALVLAFDVCLFGFSFGIRFVSLCFFGVVWLGFVASQRQRLPL